MTSALNRKKGELTMANVKKSVDTEIKQDAAADENTAAENKPEDAKPESGAAGTAEVLETINKTVDSVAGAASDKPSTRTNKIPLDEEIAVRSVTFGGLTWISPKTNAHYRWNEIGAVEYIQFGELVTMNNTSQVFLTEPYVILQDERAVEYFRLKSVYEKIAVVESLEELFKEGDLVKIEKALRDIRNTSMRNVAISKIKELRGTHTLNNIDVIRLIERILCFDME